MKTIDEWSGSVDKADPSHPLNISAVAVGMVKQE